MNLSGVSSTSPMGQILRLPLRLLPPGHVMPVLQGPLKGARWIVGSSNHGCWLGSYEHDKQRLLARTVKTGNNVYDIGANVGFYSLLFSRLVGLQGQVVAFEPLPENFACLSKHLSLNDCKNVTAIQAALSSSTGTARFRRGPSNSMGQLHVGGEIEINSWSLDNWISNNMAPLPSCLKIDVEGGEYAVLKGAHNVLKTCHPLIFLATHGQDVHDQCVSYLSDLGYDLAPITGQSLDLTDELIATWE